MRPTSLKIAREEGDEAVAPPSSSGTDADLEKLSFYLGRCYLTYVELLKRVLVKRGLAAHLKPGMGNVLFALFERDEQTLGEICERLGMPKSTMTGLAKRMVHAGVVDLKPDPQDGRIRRLALTELGRSLEPACRETSHEVNRALQGELGEEGLRDVISHFQGMLSRLHDAIAGYDEGSS